MLEARLDRIDPFRITGEGTRARRERERAHGTTELSGAKSRAGAVARPRSVGSREVTIDAVVRHSSRVGFESSPGNETDAGDAVQVVSALPPTRSERIDMSRRLLPLVGLAFVVLLVVLARMRGERESHDALGSPAATRSEPAAPAANEPDAHPPAEGREPVATVPPKRKQRAEARPAPDLPAGEATLVVRAVKQGTNEPVAGADVMAFPEKRRRGSTEPGMFWPGNTPHTDERGLCEVKVDAGVSHSLTVGMLLSDPGPESQAIGQTNQHVEALGVGERFEVLVELPCGEDLSYWGRILSELDGTPIGGAQVVLLAQESPTSSDEDAPASGAAPPIDFFRGEVRAESDAQGLFELRTHSWYPGVIALKAAGYGTRVVELDAGHEASERACPLRLLPSASLRVRVLDAAPATMRPTAVELSCESYELGCPLESSTLDTELGPMFLDDARPSWSASCDASGSCTFEALPARAPLDVSIRGGGHERTMPDGITLEPGELREVAWRLGGGARVRGRVLDQDGRPVAGLTLWVVAGAMVWSYESSRCLVASYWENDLVATADTAEDGTFAFDSIEPGRWWVGPAAPSRTPPPVAPEGIRIDVPAGVAELTVDLAVHRGLSIHGRVLPPDGQESVQCYVTATRPELPGSLDADCDEGGSFELGPLSPGDWKLVADAFGSFANSEPVTARAGDEGVVLRLRLGGKLSGRVVEKSTGRPVGAIVHWSNRPWWNEGYFSTESEADGAFAIDALAPGRYELAAVTAVTAGGEVGFLRGLEVGPGTEASDLVIEVEPGARLALRAAGGSDGWNFVLTQRGTPFAFDRLRSGNPIVEPVPPGTIAIEHQVGTGEPMRREVTIEVGGELEVELP